MTEHPEITRIRKVETKPPTWLVDVGGHTVEVGTEQLLTYRKFQLACVEQHSLVYPLVSDKEWIATLQSAMRKVEVELPPKKSE